MIPKSPFKSAEEMVNAVQTVYTLPATFHRLSEAINSPESTMDEIAEIISNDQSMCMRVLELANSAFYGFPAKIETISNALTLIGAQQIRDLVLGTTVVEMFEGIPSELVNMRSFWRHSIACGLTAKIIASLRREPNVERFFVLGLLHDIGRMVMFQKIPEIMTDLLQQAPQKEVPLYKLELEVLQYTHEDVGAALMTQWKFPLRLSEGVRKHHQFSSFAKFPLESAVIHLADICAHSFGFDGSGERFVPPIHPMAWTQLSLDPTSFKQIEKELDRQIQEVMKIMIGN
ncbi:MAG: HDOD domain-containing protein [Verrucomicrobiota bacterium]